MKKFLLVFILIISVLIPTGCEHVSSEEAMRQYKEMQVQYTYHYPILSVFQYVKTSTNRYGAITNRDICYSFTWLDTNNNLHQEDDYENLEYGLTHVQLGDEDIFEVCDYGEGHSCLYLTEETLKNMNH